MKIQGGAGEKEKGGEGDAKKVKGEGKVWEGGWGGDWEERWRRRRKKSKGSEKEESEEAAVG